MFVLLCLAKLLLVTNIAWGYKILLYNPQLGHSHVQFMGSIADVLAEAGHDITVYLPGLNSKVNITGTKLAQTIVRPRDYEVSFDDQFLVSNAWTQQGASLSQIIKFADQKSINDLRAMNFDLGIVEVYNTCGYALFHKLGIPVYLSAFATNLVEQATIPFGIENNPSFVPGAFNQLSDEMTYFERMKNLLTMIVSKILMKKYVPSAQYFSELIPGFDLREAIGKSAYVLVNSDELLEFPRPINHKIVFVSGVAVKKPKRLPEEYAKILESAEGPVTLISFGSIARSSEMPFHIRNSFLEAFKSFPDVTFIWKYEAEDNTTRAFKNVHEKKWVPQNDLLNHPKVTAFISHCGLNSVTESTHAGVPILCIPLFGDQMRNAKMAEKRGIGYLLDKSSLNAKTLTEAIETMLYTGNYKTKAKRLAHMIKKKPISVKERLIKSVEFAAEFQGTENLQPASTRLNFVQYYLLDIILPLLLLFITLCISSALIMLRLFQKCFRFIKIKKE